MEKVWIYNKDMDAAIEVPIYEVRPGWEPLTADDERKIHEFERRKIIEERELWRDLLG